MSLDSMRETRRRGESKRLELVSALVKEARDAPSLTIRLQTQLLEEALTNATGLTRDSSKATFLSECKLVLEEDVLTSYDSILKLSDKIWTERQTASHSKYHIVMKICKLVAGRRRLASLKYKMNEIEEYYDAHGSLPY